MDPPKDLDALLRGAVVAYAVNIALGAGPFLRFLPQLSLGAAGGFSSGGIDLELRRTGRTRTYQVGDRTWVSAQLEWQAAKDFHYLPPAPEATRGVFPTGVHRVEFTFEATVLLEIEDSTARSAETVSVGPLMVAGLSEVLT